MAFEREESRVSVLGSPVSFMHLHLLCLSWTCWSSNLLSSANCPSLSGLCQNDSSCRIPLLASHMGSLPLARWSHSCPLLFKAFSSERLISIVFLPHLRREGGDRSEIPEPGCLGFNSDSVISYLRDSGQII